MVILKTVTKIMVITIIVEVEAARRAIRNHKVYHDLDEDDNDTKYIINMST